MIYKRLLYFLLSFLLLAPVFGQSGDEPAPKVANLMAIRRITEMFLRSIYQPPGIEIVYEIYHLEEEAGVQFDREKVFELAKTLLFERGRELEHRRCFTCGMEVLTPKGGIPIGEIKEGDVVLSWDFKTNRLVESVVAVVHELAAVEYGELGSAIASSKVEVSPSHPFYSPDLGGFFPIGEIGENNQLQGIRGNSCKLVFGTRGYFKMKGTAVVRSLSLKGPFKTYFINGLLVHNKPIPIS